MSFGSSGDMYDERAVCKTADALFMAQEVTHNAYMFSPPLFIDENNVMQEDPYFDMVCAPFRLNPLHDLESVWWILAWTILRYTSPDSSGTNSDGGGSVPQRKFHYQRERQEMLRGKQNMYMDIFVPPFPARRHAFPSPDIFHSLPPGFGTTTLYLERLISRVQQYLTSRYARAEASLPDRIDDEAFGLNAESDVYSVMIRALDNMYTRVREEGVDRVVRVVDVYDWSGTNYDYDSSSSSGSSIGES